MERGLLNDCYSRIVKLGQGSFGSVFLCQRVHEKPNNFILNKFRSKPYNSPSSIPTRSQYVAIKKFTQSKENSNTGCDCSTLREIKLLPFLNHPNIIKAEEVFSRIKEDKYQMYLVMEYMLELQDVISSNDMKDENTLKIIAYHVLLGLHYLHEDKNIFHRDLKPMNIFISKNGLAKIADFGFAREFGTPDRQFTKTVCTAQYRAPEIFFQSRVYTEKSDIWSFGCILGYLFTRDDIFPAHDQSQIVTLQRMFYLVGSPTEETWRGWSKLPKCIEFQATARKAFDKVLGVPSETARIMEWCLQLDPRLRPSTRQLLEDPYFQGLQNKTLKVSKFYEGKLNSLLTR